MSTSSVFESWLGTDRRILALATARMADAMGNSFLIIVLPLYVSSEAVTGLLFGIPTSLVSGVVLALFGIASSVTQPFAGRISDRLGRRKEFVLWGLVVFTGVNLAFAGADQYWQLFVLRIVQGGAAAFTITASIALVNEVSEPKTRGGHMGVYNSFRLVGFGAGPLVASTLVEMGPFRFGDAVEVSGFDATFGVAAGATLLSAVMVALLVQDPEETAASSRRFVIRLWNRRGGGLDPVFALGVATLVMAACIALISAIEPEVNARLDQGPVMFSVEFVALVAALAVMQPFVGRASDTYGRHPFILGGLIGLVPTTLLQGFVHGPGEMIVLRVLQGGAASMVFAPALALAGDYTPLGHSGAQLSVLTVAFGVGIASGQLLAGFFVPYGFPIPFCIGGLVAAGAALLVYTQVHAPD